MRLQKLILNMALFFMNIFTFWCRPKPNRIVFCSLTQDHLDSDFKLLSDALEKENRYEIHYNLVVFKNNVKGKLKYFINCLHQIREYKCASLVIINDNNYVLSHAKPKGCRVLQIWHACGAVKKFGNEIERKYPIQNYDYVLCNAEYWKDVYARSFGVNYDQVYVTGMPRTDRLFKMNKEAFYKKYPQCKGKKLLFYAPTFRGNIMDGFEVISFDIRKVQEKLSDWIIVYKFHPLLGNIDIKDTQAVNVNTEDLYELMQACDCLVSDYSSVIFDYSLLHKPMIGYMPDLESYRRSIGLNIDLREFPGEMATNDDELLAAIQNLKAYDYRKNRQFQQKYMKYTDGHNTDRCVAFINEKMGDSTPQSKK